MFYNNIIILEIIFILTKHRATLYRACKASMNLPDIPYPEVSFCQRRLLSTQSNA